MKDVVLEVNNLFVYYGDIPVVRDVSFRLEPGSSLGIVGESGCGKTTLLRSFMALDTKNEKTDGSIRFCGREMTRMNKKELRSIRGGEMAMIPQNASSSMDHTRTVSALFHETMRAHGFSANKKESDKKAAELMKSLMLEDTDRILRSYPFELSGGMCQRVSIAAAMINGPKLLLGDEPTSALDVTSQLEVVKQLKRLKETFDVSMIIISHNMGVVAALADEIAVMYGGRIVEHAKRDELLSSPAHPYTKALIEAVPDLKGNISKGLDGLPPSFTKELTGCPFVQRCPQRMKECETFRFEYRKAGENHKVGCLLFPEKEVR